MNVLFITNTDLKNKSFLNGNIDADKILPFIKVAQDIYLEQYLGTKLFNKIKTLIVSGEIALPINKDYNYLLTEYIKPVTIYSALIEYMPSAAYKFTNGGVFKHLPESSESVSKNEVDFLIEKQRYIANVYARRMVDWLCEYSNLFPEYFQNKNSDIQPTDNNYNSSWNLK